MFILLNDKMINVDYVKKVEFFEGEAHQTTIRCTTIDGTEEFIVGGEKKDAILRFQGPINEKLGVLDLKTFG